MKGCLIALGIVVGVVLVGVVGVAVPIAFPTTFHIRYRIEFDVKVGDQIHVGSGVIEVVYPILPDAYSSVGGSSTGVSHVYGYAVTTDLGERGLLFAVFRTNAGSSISVGYTPLVAYGLRDSLVPSEFKVTLRELEKKSGWVTVPVGAMPWLVRFRNINDPLSAERVDPEHLSATFGEGVELVRTRLELTSDPISEMPNVWPAWLKAFNAGNLGGVESTSEAPLALQAAEFRGY